MIDRVRRSAPLATVLVLFGVGCANSTKSTVSRSADVPKHTYVIVHGAWGGGWNFRQVGQLLAERGNRVSRPTLTGQGERVHLASPEVGLSTHVQDVVNHILYEDLHDVVLVGHSYGGMVITGVVDRVPDRIRQVIYLDAILPEDGQSANDVMGREASTRPVVNGFILPTWVKEGTPPPHDVPQSARTFREPIVLKNPAAARAVPATYILTVDPGKTPESDRFHKSYERAKQRAWEAVVMEGDHNVQWSKPKELTELLVRATR